MKTAFRKIFILITMVLAFGLDLSYADNRSIDEIKNEIQVLKDKFSKTNDSFEKKQIDNKISKLIDDFLKNDKTT